MENQPDNLSTGFFEGHKTKPCLFSEAGFLEPTHSNALKQMGLKLLFKLFTTTHLYPFLWTRNHRNVNSIS